MRKLQLPGVKKLPRGGRSLIIGAVHGVAPQRKARLSKMHAYLMRASGEQAHGKQRKTAGRRRVKRAPPGERAAPALLLGHHGHARFYRRMPSDGQIAGSFGRRHPARDRKIGLMHAALRKIFDEPQPGPFRKRHDHKAGGVLVQTMHDAGPRPFLKRKLRKARQHPMHQRARRAARTRMHGQPGGLVDHGDVRIAVHDVERPLFRRQRVRRSGHGELHNLTGTHPVIGIRTGRAVHKTAALLHQLLHPAAGKLRRRSEKGVQAHLLRTRRNLKAPLLSVARRLQDVVIGGFQLTGKLFRPRVVSHGRHRSPASSARIRS